jgi:hypothetical protein
VPADQQCSCGVVHPAHRPATLVRPRARRVEPVASTIAARTTSCGSFTGNGGSPRCAADECVRMLPPRGRLSLALEVPIRSCARSRISRR